MHQHMMSQRGRALFNLCLYRCVGSHALSRGVWSEWRKRRQIEYTIFHTQNSHRLVSRCYCEAIQVMYGRCSQKTGVDAHRAVLPSMWNCHTDTANTPPTPVSPFLPYTPLGPPLPYPPGSARFYFSKSKPNRCPIATIPTQPMIVPSYPAFLTRQRQKHRYVAFPHFPYPPSLFFEIGQSVPVVPVPPTPPFPRTFAHFSLPI